MRFSHNAEYCSEPLPIPSRIMSRGRRRKWSHETPASVDRSGRHRRHRDPPYPDTAGEDSTVATRDRAALNSFRSSPSRNDRDDRRYCHGCGSRCQPLLIRSAEHLCREMIYGPFVGRARPASIVPYTTLRPHRTAATILPSGRRTCPSPGCTSATEADGATGCVVSKRRRRASVSGVRLDGRSRRRATKFIAPTTSLIKAHRVRESVPRTHR